MPKSHASDVVQRLQHPRDVAGHGLVGQSFAGRQDRVAVEVVDRIAAGPAQDLADVEVAVDRLDGSALDGDRRERLPRRRGQGPQAFALGARR